jgi:hypothetical protein
MIRILRHMIYCKSWKECLKVDRRIHMQVFSEIAIIAAFFTWMSALGIAQSVDAVKLDTELSWHVTAIFGLIGAYIALASWTFVSNIQDIKKNARNDFDNLKSMLLENRQMLSEHVEHLRQDHLTLIQNMTIERAAVASACQKNRDEIKLELDKKVPIQVHNIICEKQI